jgi:hypothetical protein
MHAQHAIDLIVRRVRSFIEQVLRSRDNAGRAEAALQASACDEAIGKQIALALAESFEREHMFSRHTFRRHRAGDNRPTFHDDCAATALSRGAAPVFRRDQSAIVAKQFQKRSSVFYLNRSLRSVQVEFKLSWHVLISYRLRACSRHFTTFDW